MVVVLNTPRHTTEPVLMSETGADPTGVEDATPFFNRWRNTGRPLIVDGTFLISDPGSIPDPYSPGKGGLHLIGAGGVLKGYGGWGFHVFGGYIDLSGDLTFQDFREPGRVGPGSDWQRGPYPGTPGARGAVIGIREYSASNPTSISARRNTPARVEYLRVGPGVRFLRSRMGITCSGAARNDLTDDTSNLIREVKIDGLYTNDVACPLIFSGTAARSGHVVNSTFLNCIGGFQEVGAIRIGPDDVPIAPDRDAIPEFQKYSGFSVMGNTIDTVIQKVTSGDSSEGNQFSSIGIICNGWGVVICNNVVNNVTGANADCEGIYTKSVGGIVSNNTLHNSGTIEAAIAIKGYDPSLANTIGVRGLGLGAATVVTGNQIRFDEYTYAHTGHSNVSGPPEIELIRHGITVNSGSHCHVFGNSVEGANGHAYLIDTDNTAYPEKTDTSIQSNRVLKHRGFAAIYMADGKFIRTKVDDNDIQFAEDENARRYAKRDQKWYPTDYIAGVETGSLTEALIDTSISDNRITLLGTTQAKPAHAVLIRAKEGDVDSHPITNLVTDRNDIIGRGRYMTSTIRYAVPGIIDTQKEASFVARGVRNTYQPEEAEALPDNTPRPGAAAALLVEADTGSLPLNFSFTGSTVLRNIQTRRLETSKIWEMPLRGEQAMTVTVVWSASRLDVTPSLTYTATGVYKVVLMRSTGTGSFIATHPEPRDPNNTSDLTDPYNVIAYGDAVTDPANPILPSPNFTLIGRGRTALDEQVNTTRLLLAVRDWIINHTHGAGSLTTPDGITGRTGTSSALTLPTGVTWPSAPPSTTDYFRTPEEGELVYAAPRDQGALPHGIVAETYPTLFDAHFEAGLGYPKLYTRTERRFNKNGSEYYVAVIRFDPEIDGEWRFRGDITI